MTYSPDTRIGEALAILEVPARALLNALLDGEAAYNDLLEMKQGSTAAEWARRLHGLADTGTVKLTVDATAKTVSCIPGANVFKNFNIGRKVLMSGLVEAGNNVASEIITALDPDEIALGDATTLVDETTEARVEMLANAKEVARADDLIDAAKDMHDGYEGMADVSALTKKDRLSSIRRIT